MSCHTFVICAFRESPYLEECIRSLKKQSVKSRILIATSTPNEHISSLAEKYDLTVRINDQAPGIAQDWNFAYRQADTDYVTIAHQDDIYEPRYAETIVRRLRECPNAVIAFSDYGELRNGQKIKSSLLLNIKRIMLLPIRFKKSEDRVWVKRLVIRFGNPICCPATTFVRAKLKGDPFEVRFSSNVDWMMLERESRRPVAFCYVPKIEMFHRIHQESTTTKIIGEDNRWKEDYEMFCRFWPKWIARVLVRVYRKSEKSNII